MEISFARLDNIAHGDNNLRAELLELFFKSCEKCIGEMQDSLTADKDQSWQMAAHELKGAADNLGFTRLSLILKTADISGNLTEEEKRYVISEAIKAVDEIKISV